MTRARAGHEPFGKPSGNAGYLRTPVIHCVPSLWLDNITRDLLTSGALKRYIDELTAAEILANPATRRRQVTMTISLKSPRAAAVSLLLKS